MQMTPHIIVKCLAAVECVDPPDVPFGHTLCLSNVDWGCGERSDGFLAILGEGSSPIVHDGVVVIGSVQVVGVRFAKVEGHGLFNIGPVDSDVLVAVTPGLLMVEAQGMVELMLDDAFGDTASSLERQHLFTSLFPQSRVAATFILHTDVVVLALTLDKEDAGLAFNFPQSDADQLPLITAKLTADSAGNGNFAV